MSVCARRKCTKGKKYTVMHTKQPNSWLEPLKVLLKYLEYEKRLDTLNALWTLAKVLYCAGDTSRSLKPTIILGIFVGSSTGLREFEQVIASRKLVDEQMSS